MGRDSYKNYDACFLCLQTARDPVCCSQGHLACQECMYESILQQKQAIALQQRTLDQQTQEKQVQKQLNDLEAQRVILDTFDKTQNSMLGNRDDKKRKREVEEEKEEKEDKRTLNEQAIDETALQLKKEKEEAAKPKIGSFWVVSSDRICLCHIIN